MSHLKRQKVPKTWPIPRKGTKYIVKPNFGTEKGVPLLIFLRDMLKVVKNRKEVKKALHEKKILVNNKHAKDEKNNIQLFDKITLVPAKKYYNFTISSNGKFEAEEIKESEVGQKVAKVINKKILKGKKVQLNLLDGRNFLSDTKCNINDSVIVKFKDKKIIKCLPLKEKANVIVFAGKHLGETGTITSFKPERKMASLEIAKKKVDILIKQLMVVE